MSRFTTRGRDPWSSRGTPLHYRQPMAREAGPLRFTTIAGLAVALFALAYFGCQLLRGALS